MFLCLCVSHIKLTPLSIVSGQMWRLGVSVIKSISRNQYLTELALYNCSKKDRVFQDVLSGLTPDLRIRFTTAVRPDDVGCTFPCIRLAPTEY